MGVLAPVFHHFSAFKAKILARQNFGLKRSFAMIEIIPNWHPIFVHFTVALLSTAVGFFLLAWIAGKKPIQKQCLVVAHWNLWLGTGFAVITAIAGWFAYNSVAHDALSHAAMSEHRNWALGTLALLLPLTLWAWWNHHTGKTIQVPFLVFALVLLGLLLSTAWHGGELVYRYGIGVMSLPTSESSGHTHEGTGGHVHSSEIKSPESHEQADDMENDYHTADATPDDLKSDDHEADSAPDDHNHAADGYSH
ncbi:MAG: hypothetical protein DRR19_29285 [Candidatus Parabeggiatoa sp. nov. 1]|nr:MAG: hypothetical protein DRR19_29285 [Gammaproteobacteria bacterium]